MSPPRTFKTSILERLIMLHKIRMSPPPSCKHKKKKKNTFGFGVQYLTFKQKTVLLSQGLGYPKHILNFGHIWVFFFLFEDVQ